MPGEIASRGRRISVLVSTFNRRELTLASLERLLGSASPGLELSVHLVDSSSSDGTPEAVAAAYPDVTITSVSSDHYWVAAMRAGFDQAIADDPDHLLMYNDDTMLGEAALTRLVEAAELLAQRGDAAGIVTGTLCDAASGAVTYGGITQDEGLRTRMRFRSHVTPGDKPKRADTCNFNLALIARPAYRAVGNLDGAFTHSMADLDYGLRARAAGYPTWVAPGFHGTCSDNPEKVAWQDRRLRPSERWKMVRGPKGLPPREFALFCRRWGGPAWPILAVAPYARLLLSPASDDGTGV